MKRIGTLLVLCGVALGSAQNASALEVLSLNPSGAFLDGAATFATGFGANAGIILPDGDTASSFAVGFVLPVDYVTGSPIQLGIAWHTTAAATPCFVELQPDFLSVARVGRTHIVGPGIKTGLTPADGSAILVADATNVTDLKLYSIESPDSDTPLQAFDVINLGLVRESGGEGDTCAGDVVVQGIAIVTQ